MFSVSDVSPRETTPAPQPRHVFVKRSKNRSEVTDWIAGRDEAAGRLFLLIDETCDNSAELAELCGNQAILQREQHQFGVGLEIE